MFATLRRLIRAPRRTVSRPLRSTTKLSCESMEDRVTPTSIDWWIDPVPSREGTPATPSEVSAIANFATTEGIDRINLDSYGNGGTDPYSGNRLLPSADAATAAANQELHAAGLQVFALNTDFSRIPALLAWNASHHPSQRFDGIRVNWEVIPRTAQDIQVYANAKAVAGSFPLHVTLAHHWNAPITYNGVTKEAHKHIQDIVDGVTVQAYFDTPAVMQQVSADEVAYGRLLNKEVIIGAETQDIVRRGLGLAHNTFFEEGKAVMKSRLATVSFPGVPAGQVEFNFHFWQRSMGYAGTDLPGWYDPAAAPAQTVEAHTLNDGRTYSRTSDGKLYQHVGSNRILASNGGIADIERGLNNTALYVLTTSGQLWQLSPNWTLVSSGGIAQIEGTGRNLYLLTTGGQLWRIAPTTGWAYVSSGGIADIAATHGNGSVLLRTTSGQVWQINDYSGGWALASSGGITDMYSDEGGYAAYLVTSDGRTYRIDSSGWTLLA